MSGSTASSSRRALSKNELAHIAKSLNEHSKTQAARLAESQAHLLESNREWQKLVGANESLTFRNQQLLRRVAELQEQLAQQKPKGSKKSNGQTPRHDPVLEQRLQVLEEALEAKITENERLVRENDSLFHQLNDQQSMMNGKSGGGKMNGFDVKETIIEEPAQENPMNLSKLISALELESDDEENSELSKVYVIYSSSVAVLFALRTFFYLFSQRLGLHPCNGSLETLPERVEALRLSFIKLSQFVEELINEARVILPRIHAGNDLPEIWPIVSTPCGKIKNEVSFALEQLLSVVQEENKVPFVTNEMLRLNCDAMESLYFLMNGLIPAFNTPSMTLSSLMFVTRIGEINRLLSVFIVSFSAKWNLEKTLPCLAPQTINVTNKILDQASDLNLLLRKLQKSVVQLGEERLNAVVANMNAKEFSDASCQAVLNIPHNVKSEEDDTKSQLENESAEHKEIICTTEESHDLAEYYKIEVISLLEQVNGYKVLCQDLEAKLSESDLSNERLAEELESVRRNYANQIENLTELVTEFSFKKGEEGQNSSRKLNLLSLFGNK